MKEFPTLTEEEVLTYINEGMFTDLNSCQEMDEIEEPLVKPEVKDKPAEDEEPNYFKTKADKELVERVIHSLEENIKNGE